MSHKKKIMGVCITVLLATAHFNTLAQNSEDFFEGKEIELTWHQEESALEKDGHFTLKAEHIQHENNFLVLDRAHLNFQRKDRTGWSIKADIAEINDLHSWIKLRGHCQLHFKNIHNESASINAEQLYFDTKSHILSSDHPVIFHNTQSQTQTLIKSQHGFHLNSEKNSLSFPKSSQWLIHSSTKSHQINAQMIRINTLKQTLEAEKINLTEIEAEQKWRIEAEALVAYDLEAQNSQLTLTGHPARLYENNELRAEAYRIIYNTQSQTLQLTQGARLYQNEQLLQARTLSYKLSSKD